MLALSVLVLLTPNCLLQIPRAAAQGPPPGLDPLPEVGGLPAGYVNGSFGVTETGAAAYTIDLAVPPGTGGLAPKLALKYDSRGTGTILGTGWSLSGLSAITRCPTTLAQDGSIDGPDFDDNDKFCLDGQRLVAVGGVYGASFTEYRTENESFAQVVSYATAGSGPESFVAKTKAGLVYTYGQTEDARVEAQGRDDVLIWLVNRVEDTTGNYFTVAYYEDQAAGESYPLRIDYTGNAGEGLLPYNSIRFAYEARGNPILRFIGGAKTRLGTRLERISMFTDEDLAWSYDLTYEETPVTRSSRLVRIAECDEQGTCLPSTDFTWDTEADGATAPMTNPVAERTGNWANWSPYPGDFNGDGLTDMAVIKAKSTGHGVYVSLATGGGAFAPSVLVDSQSGGWQNWAPYLGDFNGDGMTDIAMIKMDSNGTFGYEVKVRFATGGGNFTPLADAYQNVGGWANWSPYLGDFNGDGVTDIAAIKMDSNGAVGYKVWINIANGDGTFQPTSTAYEYAGGWANWRPYLGDFNGDGMTDIAAIKMDSNGAVGYKVWISLASGEGAFQPIVTAYEYSGGWANWSPYLGDFNGDGVTDIAAIKMDSNGAVGYKVWISLASGDGTFQPASSPYEHAGGWSGWSPYLADFNGDGVTDIAAIKATDSDHKVWLNLGRQDGTFAPGRSVVGIPGGWSLYTPRLGDFNGDGLADVAMVYLNKAGYHINLHTTLPGATGHIAAIAPDHGSATAIEYAPLTDGAVYAKDTDAAFPVRDVQGPMYVVSAYEQENGAGGVNRMSYDYRGLKILLDGRGFCGFREMTFTDEATGIETRTFFRQDHPYKSMAYRKETRLADGTLIHRTEDTWDATVFDDFPNERYFPHVVESVEESFEIDGILIDVVTTLKTFDDYGNVIQIGTSHSDGHTALAANTYENDTANWFLGRLLATEVTKQAPGQPALTRVSGFSYSETTGLLVEETVEPDHPTLWRKKTYAYDGFGNISATTTSGYNVAPRTRGTSYDDRGRFVTQTTNELGQSEHKTYDVRHGKIASLTDANGLTTEWEYDGLGRVRHELRPDGTETRTLTLLADAMSPPRAAYYVRTDSSGATPSIVYYDLLNRPVRSETVGFDGSRVFSDTEYTARGEVYRTSEPYFEGEAPLWTVNEYDVLGRLVRSTAPGGRVTSTTYDGYVTTVVNPANQSNTRIVNSLEQLAESRDNLGHAIHYTYDSQGNMIDLRDPAGNATTMQYDLVGNKTSMTDPDGGTKSYVYDALGQLVAQTDAKNQTVSFTYDALGRMLTRTEAEGTSTFTYDAVPNGIGKVSRLTSAGGGHVETYAYDAFGRLHRVTATLGADSYVMSYGYDPYGRVQTITYPSGFAIRHEYNPRGYLERVLDNDTGNPYWQASSMNARGQLVEELFGNGLAVVRSFDPMTGHQTRAQAGTIQDLAFAFDAIGNLVQRRDALIDATESFSYDALNRLVQASVAGGETIVVAYDDLGNITAMTHVGEYTYGEGGAGPHAVTSIAGERPNVYSYDANGNRVSDANGGVLYSSFDKPMALTRGNTTLAFSYSASRSRYSRVTTVDGVVEETKLYVGGLYEREITPTSSKDIHFIRGGDSIVAIRTTETGRGAKTRYLHNDHLGSIHTVSDELGAAVEVQSFDAWGNRRNADWTRATSPLGSAETDRGFTGHEMLDAVNLIHMNGRVYDPVIGRFLSADPAVQAPESTQALNRYSYVLNNPLSYSDPSGFFFSGLFKTAKKVFQKVVVPAAIAYISFQSGAWFSGNLLGIEGFVATVTSAVVSSVVSSTSSAVINGGSLSDALRSALRGAAVRVATQELFVRGGVELSDRGQYVFNQASGAAVRLASGGRLDHEYFSELFLTTALRGGADVGSRVVSWISNSANGTVSEVNGEKFSNGAVTESFGEAAAGSVPIPGRKPPRLAAPGGAALFDRPPVPGRKPGTGAPLSPATDSRPTLSDVKGVSGLASNVGGILEAALKTKFNGVIHIFSVPASRFHLSVAIGDFLRDPSLRTGGELYTASASLLPQGVLISWLDLGLTAIDYGLQQCGPCSKTFLDLTRGYSSFVEK